jgi:sugar lactone lactonase YvrE
VTVVLAGCSGSGGSANVGPSVRVTPSPSPSGSVTPGPSPTPTPHPSATPSPTPTPTPTSSSLASGSIYVADSGDSNITIYAPNPIGAVNELPTAQINGVNTGLNGPSGVAVDAFGRIYVANKLGGSGSGSITVYAANPSGTVNATPLATITGAGTGLSGPTAIALDASGKIYVANSGNAVTVYAANPSGTLNEAPLATITGVDTQIASPYGIAVDAAGTIYLANELGGFNLGLGGSVTTYAANPSGTLDEVPVGEILGSNTALNSPLGVAVDASGKIYVANLLPSGSSVTVYAANPSGILNEAPLATIAGGATELGTSAGIALDSSGRIYVSNQYGQSNNSGAITVFAANPSGTLNEAPLGAITGSNSRLYDSAGLAVH